MRKVAVTGFLCVFMAWGAFAQTSRAERTGFWPTGTTWVGGVVPGTLSGGTITVNSKTVVIDGTVKSVDNLNITLSNITINAGDTLVILGNFTIGLSTFSNNGVMIVMGDFNNNLSNSSISGSGKLVVTGNYNNNIGANTFTGPSYVYGSTNGFFTPPPVGDQGDLSSTDPALFNYVNNQYSVLPVELVFFQAETVGSYVTLLWQTATELNNDHFRVERSTDGRTFHTISTVLGAGNSKNPINYSCTDYNPITGTSYYRLTQVDYDGTITSFTIITAFTESKPLEIYPNPTTEYLFIAGARGNSKISIKGATGGNRAFNIQVQELLPGKLGIDVRNLEPGLYYLQVEDSENRESALSQPFRFIRQ
jgi:hypothetical protein